MNLLMQAINKCATLGSLVTTMNVRGDDPLTLNTHKLDNNALDAIAKSRDLAGSPTSPDSKRMTPSKSHKKRPSTSSGISSTPSTSLDNLEIPVAERNIEVPPLLRFHST